MTNMLPNKAAPLPLLISEVFGPTVQGEGPHAGRRCAFVRLGGCNLACSWCDTPYTWDAARFDLRKELVRVPTHTIVSDVLTKDVKLVVISGGEPLLQDKDSYALTDLVDQLARAGIGVDIETNGTIRPTNTLAGMVKLFVVSPKLAHAGMDSSRTHYPNVLRYFAGLASIGQAVLKIVCQDVEDVHRALSLAMSSGFEPGHVWVMPEGTTFHQVGSRTDLAESALSLGMNFTGRAHIELWGQARGR